MLVAARLLRTGVVRARRMMSACNLVLRSVQAGRACNHPRAGPKRQRQAEDQRGHQNFQHFGQSDHGHTMGQSQQESLIKINIAARVRLVALGDLYSICPDSPCWAQALRSAYRTAADWRSAYWPPADRRSAFVVFSPKAASPLAAPFLPNAEIIR